MANANGRQGAISSQRPHGGMPQMSPLSETLWRDKITNTSTVGDTSARLTWVDLWVSVFRGGSKQAILQGLTGLLFLFKEKNMLSVLHCISD